MVNITTAQKRQLFESYKNGIIRELYAKAIISEEQFRRLMQKN